MPESLTFHFEGALADENQMNFYEASRFQYAAARLMVKLLQFRASGDFVKKITNQSNYNILINPATEGSFNINVTAPDSSGDYKQFVDLTVADLLSYVSERLVGKGDEAALISSINANAAVLKDAREGRVESAEEADQVVARIVADRELREQLYEETREVIERRIAEIAREARLRERRAELAKIDAPREQKLLSMSAPLVSEMATALRRSADSLEVFSDTPSG